MKTKFLLLFLILFLASASQGQTVQTRSTVESPEEASAPVRMLYDFYRKYMEYMAVMPHSQAFEDSLKRACLTPKSNGAGKEDVAGKRSRCPYLRTRCKHGRHREYKSSPYTRKQLCGNLSRQVCQTGYTDTFDGGAGRWTLHD